MNEARANKAQANETANPGGAMDSPITGGRAASKKADAEGDLNTASGLIEAPLKLGGSKLKQHDFPDGGGSGGAEAFRRKPS